MCPTNEGGRKWRNLWKKWKITHNRMKQLRKLGANFWQAVTWENCRKGYTRCTTSFLNSKVTNDLLKKKRSTIFG